MGQGRIKEICPCNELPRGRRAVTAPTHVRRAPGFTRYSTSGPGPDEMRAAGVERAAMRENDDRDGGLEHGCVSRMGVKMFIDLDENTKPEAGSVARKIGQNAQQQLFELYLKQMPAPH